MDLFASMGAGFQVSLQPVNLLFCFIGVLIGTLVGVLPGLGPTATLALLLPLTYKMDPTTSIIMLAGIYYGAMYGGSTTSILVNMPGEAASAVTCIDGYQMARQGRAGPALGICAFSSFIGGTISILGLAFLAPLLSQGALKFGPPEYTSLMVLGLVLVSFMSGHSILKSLIVIVFGLVLGTVGLDVISGRARFSFGSTYLMGGLELVPVIMGLFGISEVLANIERVLKTDIYQTSLSSLLPSLRDWSRSLGPILRGSIIGFFLGILPGGGAILSSFVSYTIEKKISKHPEQFGNGAIEGVAAPEAANNSATGGAFIPLLTLGVPANAVMAVLFGAFLIHGISPGPMIVKDHPQLFWGLITSMYVGNGMLLILNLPLIGLWVRLIKTPYSILCPLIILICAIGAFAANNNILDIYTLAIFGVLGYLMKRFGYEVAPFIMAFIIGPILESSLRRSLSLAKGSFAIFFDHPLSACLLILAGLMIAISFFSSVRKRRLTLSESEP